MKGTFSFYSNSLGKGGLSYPGIGGNGREEILKYGTLSFGEVLQIWECLAPVSLTLYYGETVPSLSGPGAPLPGLGIPLWGMSILLPVGSACHRGRREKGRYPHDEEFGIRLPLEHG